MTFETSQPEAEQNDFQPSSDGDRRSSITIPSGKGSEDNVHNSKSKFDCCGTCLRRRRSPGYAAKARTKAKAKRTRTVHVNNAAACRCSNGRAFVSNHISTAKYTLLTFFPKALFEQFRRVANIYFLFHAIVSLTSVSPVAPWTTWPALLMVLGFSLAKEGIEDYRRHKQDKQNNLSTVHRVITADPENKATGLLSICRPWRFQLGHGHKSTSAVAPVDYSANEAIYWQDIRVGDIVKVHRGQFFPADLVFLCSSGNNDGSKDDEEKESGSQDKCEDNNNTAAGSKSGTEVCFVDTKNLDGETNAKLKTAVLPGLASSTDAKMMDLTTRIASCQSLSSFRAEIECDNLNGSMYSFKGLMRKIRWNAGATTASVDTDVEPDGSGYSIPDEVVLETSNLLLRSSSLKAPDFIYGAVVHTGRDTKVMLNALAVPSKRSRIDRRIDGVIAWMFIVLALWCISGSAAHAIWTKRLVNDMWYLWGSGQGSSSTDAEYDPDRPWAAFGLGIVTSAVLYGYLIPISLYISLELVRLVQSTWLISGDAQMYCDEMERASEARTSNLAEDLGRVEVILSDKTGTLTRNQMDFYQISVAGKLYGTGVPDAESSDDPKRLTRRGLHFLDSRLFDLHWAANTEPLEVASSINSFILALALCHTVYPAQSSSSSQAADGDNEYDAESPDEEAFVIAAHRFGRQLLKRTSTQITLREEVPLQFFTELQNNSNQKVLARGRKSCSSGLECDFVKVDHQYSVLAVIQFTSERKRMSIILRRPDGRIILYCKGADTVIMPRLQRSGTLDSTTSGAESTGSSTDAGLDTVSKHLNQQASIGLRTLIFAYRELTEEEFQQWQSIYAAAATAYGGDDDNGDLTAQKKIDRATEMLESDLELLGCTAVEDSLQSNVPQTLESLRKAGLRFWMLTGDKMETAIAIGHSCKMLSSNINKIILKGYEHSAHSDDSQAPSDRDNPAFEERQQRGISPAVASASLRMQKLMSETLNTINEERAQGSARNKRTTQSLKEYACILGADALEMALQHCNRELFLQICENCTTVICCRASPLQKAQVVDLVRYGASQRRRSSIRTTLAIGDGANDVGMIRAANVGVGISGYEGRQAVLASDFALPQFRFLERLLLVHGRWNYKRIARFVQYFFYKNFYLGVTLFLYNAYAFFSGQVIYQDFALTLYSVTMTALPVLVVGVLDQDISAENAMAFPQVYHETRTNRVFTLATSTAWFILSLYQGLISFGAAFLAMPQTFGMGNDGIPATMAEVGVLLYTIVIVTANLELAITINFWTVLHHIAIWSSIAFWFLFLIVFGEVAPVEFSTTLFHIFNPGLAARPLFWIAVVIACAANLAPSFIVRALARVFAVEDYHIIQEMERRKKQPKHQEQQSSRRRWWWLRCSSLFSCCYRCRRSSSRDSDSGAGPQRPTARNQIASQEAL